jgi:hypothetical protein
MPKKSGLAGWLPYWPILLGLLSIGGWAYRTIGAHAVEDQKRDQEIQTLKGIILGEWPAYTKSFYWEK